MESIADLGGVGYLADVRVKYLYTGEGAVRNSATQTVGKSSPGPKDTLRRLDRPDWQG